MERTFYVYILASQRNGTLYVGVTSDLARRVYEHRAGEVPGFTAKYGVTQLVWYEVFPRALEAIDFEKRLKRWRRVEAGVDRAAQSTVARPLPRPLLTSFPVIPAGAQRRAGTQKITGGRQMPTPFEVRWSEAEVEPVLERVRSYPWPVAPQVPDGWAYGCDGAFLRTLCLHWTERYDWRAAVAELNRYPQFTTRIEDFDIHFVHVVGEAEGRRPLIITHGWPGSHYEFWQAVEKLAFPSRFGGQAEDAFDLVLPSLPGFGFSSKPTRPIGQRTTARLFAQLMAELGYDRYLAQGGDWGALVTGWLAFDNPAHVRAIHLNMLGLRSAGGPKDPVEAEWLKQQMAVQDQLGAYLRLQISKPQSVAWLGAGNPVGQAAWIAERFHDWTTLEGRDFETVFPLDRLLTNIMIYVMTGSFTTGAWYYRGLIEEGGASPPDGQRVEVPTAFAHFPGEPLMVKPPRSMFERAYNLVRWSDMPRGGHFAAMEEPDLFVDELRAWARQCA